MFESLTEKLGNALPNLRGDGKLTEENMAEAHKEVRTALLGADVHFKVVKQLIESIKHYAKENLKTINLDEIAQQYYLNKNYFCSLFKESTGRAEFGMNS